MCEYVKLAEMHVLPRITTIQNLYNLSARGFDTSLLETRFRSDVSLLTYSSLTFGQLTSGASPALENTMSMWPWPV